MATSASSSTVRDGGRAKEAAKKQTIPSRDPRDYLVNHVLTGSHRSYVERSIAVRHEHDDAAARSPVAATVAAAVAVRGADHHTCTGLNTMLHMVSTEAEHRAFPGLTILSMAAAAEHEAHVHALPAAFAVGPERRVGLREIRNAPRMAVIAEAAAERRRLGRTGRGRGDPDDHSIVDDGFPDIVGPSFVEMYRNACLAYEVRANSGMCDRLREIDAIAREEEASPPRRAVVVAGQHDDGSAPPTLGDEDGEVDLTCLTEIDASGLMLADRGLLPVLEVARLCPRLRSLRVDGNGLRNNGAEYLAEFLIARVEAGREVDELLAMRDRGDSPADSPSSAFAARSPQARAFKRLAALQSPSKAPTFAGTGEPRRDDVVDDELLTLQFTRPLVLSVGDNPRMTIGAGVVLLEAMRMATADWVRVRAPLIQTGIPATLAHEIERCCGITPAAEEEADALRVARDVRKSVHTPQRSRSPPPPPDGAYETPNNDDRRPAQQQQQD